MPAAVLTDIRNAVHADTCRVRVSQDEVADAYQLVFGERELDDMSPEELARRADLVASRLRADREALGFIPLPGTYGQLSRDAFGSRSIPWATYQRTLVDYLAAFGVTAVFGWDHDDPIQLAARPVTETVVGQHAAARARLLAAMEYFAATAPAEIRASGVTQVALGSVITKDPSGNTAAGVALGRTGVVAIDVTTDGPAADGVVGSSMDGDRAVLPHEIAGHVAATTWCGEAAAGADPAIAAFTPGLVYGVATAQQMEAQSEADGHTRLKGCQPGDALEGVTNTYAATEPGEDRATIAGELIHTPDLRQRLFVV